MDKNKLHSEIMNIQIKERDVKNAVRLIGIGYSLTAKDLIIKAYKYGHRDARHAAVELVLEGGKK